MVKTLNEALQLQLNRWVELVDAAVIQPNPSSERTDAILTFVRVFVPQDVTEDDIDHFSGNLSTDEVTVVVA
jgi:hypothetical protein